MKLRIARLCLDCEEIHDAQECPICASEAFAYLTRWVPVPDSADRPKPVPASVARPEARVDRERREKKATPAAPSSKWRLIVPGMVGVGVLGLAGWLWRGSARETPAGAKDAAARETETPASEQTTPTEQEDTAAADAVRE
jgi:hypothetical protein